MYTCTFGLVRKYLLQWMRGSQLRQVSSQGRLAMLAAVDEKARSVIVSWSCEGRTVPRFRLLEGVLRGLEKLPAVPLMAERSFDAVGLMQRVKDTWRVRVRSLLRQESQQGWKKYSRERYQVEEVFGVPKHKLGSWLAVVREEMAWATALLYNLSMLVVSGYLDGSFCLLVSAFFWLISAFFLASMFSQDSVQRPLMKQPQLQLTVGERLGTRRRKMQQPAAESFQIIAAGSVQQRHTMTC